MCVADGLGMYVIVRLGKYALVRGYKWYSGTSNFNKTIAANSSGNPRIDLVVLRLTRATWAVTVEVVQGTPAATPAVPALTQNTGSSGVFEIPLAEVTVASGASTIAGGNCVARDRYISSYRSIVERGNRTSSSTTTTSEVGVIKVRANLKKGQTYIISTCPLRLNTTVSGDYVFARVRYDATGSDATTGSTILSTIIGGAGAGQAGIPFWAKYIPSADMSASFLLSVGRFSGSGTVGLVVDSSFPDIDLMVIAVGADPGDTGVDI